MFVETSAKAGLNVKSLFRKIALALPGMDNVGNEAQAPSKKILMYPYGCVWLTNVVTESGDSLIRLNCPIVAVRHRQLWVETCTCLSDHVEIFIDQ